MCCLVLAVMRLCLFARMRVQLFCCVYLSVCLSGVSAFNGLSVFSVYTRSPESVCLCVHLSVYLYKYLVVCVSILVAA